MTYFNYHAKAKRLIKTGHCIGAELVDRYKNISPALTLYFDNNIPLPIRPHMFCEYFSLLKNYDIEITDLTSDN